MTDASTTNTDTAPTPQEWSETDTDTSPPARHKVFLDDTRAIEGLPVRLVIALVVGVASLSVMMGMIDGIGSLGMTELDAQPDPEVATAAETADVTITVVDNEGTPVAGATVVLQGASAQLQEDIQTATTDSSGNATVSATPRLGANQRQGTLTIDIKPPAGAEYVDKRENTEILVLRK